MVATIGNQCGTCGADGQACCGTGNNGTCATGLACSGRMNGTGVAGMCAAAAAPDGGAADVPVGQ
jgi:hypothetical protein